MIFLIIAKINGNYKHIKGSKKQINGYIKLYKWNVENNKWFEKHYKQ